MSLANLIKPTPGPLTPGVWKRRESNEDENNDSSAIKKPRYSWYVTLEDESRGATSETSDDESVYSVQDEETEYARDTSDTSTSAWMNSGDHHSVTLGVEYEVATCSESDNPFVDSSTSDPDDVVTVNVLTTVGESDDVDLERIEDTDVSITSVDSELGKADYWTCIQCNTTNNNPLFRYCERCYQLRKNLFPPRPQRKKRHQQSTKTTEAESSQNSVGFCRFDSGLGSSQYSQSQELDQNNSSQTETVSTQDTEVGKSEIDLNNGVNDDHVDRRDKKTDYNSEEFRKKMQLIRSKIKSDDDVDNKYCLVCTVNPKNGAFVHGNATHICCCYRCAVKVWKTTRHCPICQRKVTNVLKAFYI